MEAGDPDGVNDDGAYRLLFESHPRPCFVFDRENYAILAVNDAACTLYGWTREEMLAMTVRQLRQGDELARFDRLMEERRVATTHGSTNRGYKHLTKAGRVLDVDLETNRLTFHGRPAAVVAVTDVTGAAFAERRFRLLVEHCGDGIVLISEKGVIEYANPATLHLLGYRPEEMVGRSAAVLTHPDDVSSWATPDCGETIVGISRSLHRNGSWRWIESATTNLTHEPAVRGYVTSFRDATVRKENEEALRRSEANFRTLIERSPTAVFVHRGGQIVYVNPPMVAMLGYDSADDLVGRSGLELMSPEDRDLARQAIERTKAQGTSAMKATRMMRRDGSFVYIESDGVHLDFDGHPSNVVFARDVTERREMFARIAVADRMLSVGTLAAGVAHEINNPLAYVMANLAILARELPALIAVSAPSDRGGSTVFDVGTVLNDAQEGAARVSGIVRDLRALSRADDETRGPVDVVAVLLSSLKMAQNEIRHRANVVRDLGEALPAVHANASRLGQVFINLLVNAAQSIPDGRTDANEIRVRARASADGALVIVEIEDTGVGIPPSIKERIFDPFFTTKPVGVGTGLGLSICHQIVSSVGGEIAVTSEPGRGSRFRVSFPASASAVTSPGDETNGGARVHGPSARVLMIDDEPALGRSTQLLLAPQYDVVPVTRARRALERLAGGEHFDAILCDLMMPEMSGIEFHEQLARTAPEYLTRVVFMTGGAFTDQARQFLESVGRPHIDKPFSEATLRRVLDDVVKIT
ncbi:MAG: sensory box histidine kinase/response regulator [Myxococcaceae bacterium]|nr:sensory box histidine kinase/response regulator [Myxococcaceae bacterium]